MAASVAATMAASKEVAMRAVNLALALVLVYVSVSAQQRAALAAKAKSERKEGQALLAQPIVQLAPYNVSLEYRAAVANAAVHEKEAELFYVVDGAATMVTGGKLTAETRTNAENLSGTGIEGGVSRHIAKGDFIMVPENTPHWFSAIDGTITLMSLHLPHAAK